MTRILLLSFLAGTGLLACKRSFTSFKNSIGSTDVDEFTQANKNIKFENEFNFDEQPVATAQKGTAALRNLVDTLENILSDPIPENFVDTNMDLFADIMKDLSFPDDTEISESLVRTSALYYSRGFDGMGFVEIFYEWTFLESVVGNLNVEPSSRMEKLLQYAEENFLLVPVINLLMRCFETKSISKLFSSLAHIRQKTAYAAIRRILTISEPSQVNDVFEIFINCLDKFKLEERIVMLILSVPHSVSLENIAALLEVAEDPISSSGLEEIMFSCSKMDLLNLLVAKGEVSQDVLLAALKSLKPGWLVQKIALQLKYVSNDAVQQARHYRYGAEVVTLLESLSNEPLYML